MLLNLAVSAITFFVLLAVGLDLDPAHFARVRRQRRTVAVGLLGPLFVLPPLALLLVMWFAPSEEVRAGLLLIAVCPIGGISSTYSYLAGASTALSITLTAFSSLLAVVTIPLLDRVFGAVIGHAMGFVAPLPLIFAQLLLMLALPVALGMWVRFRRPALAMRVQPRFRALAFAGLVLLIVSIVASDPVQFVNGLRDAVPLAAMFVATSFLAGWLIGRVIRTPPEDGFTLAAEFATRNAAVAAAIAVALAGRVAFAFFATTYFLTEIPMMFGAIAVFRGWQHSRIPAANVRTN